MDQREKIAEIIRRKMSYYASPHEGAQESADEILALMSEKPAPDPAQEVSKPHGTIICQHCGSSQSGLLDPICDGCGKPFWLEAADKIPKKIKKQWRRYLYYNVSRDDIVLSPDKHPDSDGLRFIREISGEVEI